MKHMPWQTYLTSELQSAERKSRDAKMSQACSPMGG